MASTSEQIINDINAYIRNVGGTISSWYVGVASSARTRLFDDHGVDEKNGNWIYRQATSEAVARAVEKAYLDAGCDGGTGGGDSTTYVYAYLKTSSTNP